MTTVKAVVPLLPLRVSFMLDLRGNPYPPRHVQTCPLGPDRPGLVATGLQFQGVFKMDNKARSLNTSQ